MKKKIAFVCAFCFAVLAFGQTNLSVHIDNKIYAIISNAELAGLCDPHSYVKPYSEKVVKKIIDEIIANDNASEKKLISDAEMQILLDAKNSFERKQGFDWQRGGWYFEKEGKIHTSFDVRARLDTFVSGGLYKNKNDNQWGMHIVPEISFKGDLSNYFSYGASFFGSASRAVLKDVDQYKIGEWWYTSAEDGNGDRKINTFENKAFFPFSYHKKWEGRVWHIDNLSENNEYGWNGKLGIGMGFSAELNVSALDDKVFLCFGRIHHEWAAMDRNASLVLSNFAQPFLGFEFIIAPVKWLTISSLTGILEYPRSEHITNTIYNSKKDYAGYGLSMIFQNAYTIAMLELNFKYVHFDFGTTVIWPKRFELGYLHPLVFKLWYQNNVGDMDNLAVFANLKLTYPRFGSIWAGIYLDEFIGGNKVTGLLGDFIHSTRNMYATQVGMKARIPGLPFASLSLRYTKIEPYCYTHHAINYTWYQHYISEAYMNSGENIGYYLPPNSDELNVYFETELPKNLRAHAEYQFIRHGADHGSQAVRGSSQYSEMNPNGREAMRKYFLHDGAYQWFHILKLGGEWNLKQFKAPVTVYADVGFIYSYYTVLADASNTNTNKSFPYHKANTSEYPTEIGGILSAGVKVYY